MKKLLKRALFIALLGISTMTGIGQCSSIIMSDFTASNHSQSSYLTVMSEQGVIYNLVVPDYTQLQIDFKVAGSLVGSKCDYTVKTGDTWPRPTVTFIHIYKD